MFSQDGPRKSQMDAASIRCKVLTKKGLLNTVNIKWKQNSFLGLLGGDMSQLYNKYDYQLQNGDELPVYIQEGYESPESLLVDSKLQYGMNNGVIFLVYHNKNLKPYQHQFIQNDLEKVADVASTVLKEKTYGLVDLSMAVGDYLRDF